MSSQHARIAVVVVSWNSRDDLGACLGALASSPQPLDVVVVDNASEDGSAALVRTAFPWVRLSESGRNLGFGAACNRGIAATTAPLVVVLNPDVTLAHDALTLLADRLERSPRAAVAAPRLSSPSGELLLSCAPFPTIAGELVRLLRPGRERARRSAYPVARWVRAGDARRVDTVEGACMMLRRRALEEVGGFDERFFMYSEEVDLCRRLAGAGWEVLWAPQAAALHRGGASSRQAADRMLVELYRSKVLYFRKHEGQASARAFKLGLGAAALSRVVLAPVVAACVSADGEGAHWRRLGLRYRRLLGALASL